MVEEKAEEKTEIKAQNKETIASMSPMNIEKEAQNVRTLALMKPNKKTKELEE